MGFSAHIRRSRRTGGEVHRLSFHFSIKSACVLQASSNMSNKDNKQLSLARFFYDAQKGRLIIESLPSIVLIKVLHTLDLPLLSAIPLSSPYAKLYPYRTLTFGRFIGDRLGSQATPDLLLSHETPDSCDFEAGCRGGLWAFTRLYGRQSSPMASRPGQRQKCSCGGYRGAAALLSAHQGGRCGHGRVSAHR